MSSLTQGSRARMLSDLRARQAAYWEKGEHVSVEHLLATHPEPVNDTEILIELIHSEVLQRLKIGEQPTLEEYRQRFPRYAEQLGEMWTKLPTTAPTVDGATKSVNNSLSGTPTNLLPVTAPQLSAQWLPGFELHHKLGQGGMGVVYHARDVRLDQVRAIKLIRGGPLGDDHASTRFNREAKAAARLDHPGVVRIFSQGEHGDISFICMEFLAGGSLQARLAQGPLEIRAAADLVRQLALAIQHAHDRDVLHRDLKPSNVLLTADGVAKVSDFGLAKLLDEQDELTHTGAVMGTVGYMAPEQAEARHEDVRESVDIWALGVILYECLAGRAPFRGVNRTETLEMVKTKEPPPLRQFRVGVPPELEAVCRKCLSKQPGVRYPSAAALGDDLQAWLAGKPVRARVMAPRRRAKVLIGAALALLAVLAAASPWILPSEKRGDEPDAPAPVAEAWNPLLTREPTLLRWPANMNSDLKFRPEKREFFFACDDLGLIALGETQAPRFQVKFAFQQIPWSGNVGLFFGYQDSPVGKQPGQRCQLLEFVAVDTKDKGRRFRANWTDTNFVTGSNKRKFNTGLASSELFALTPTQHSLEVRIGPDGVREVLLNDELLTLELPPPARRPPPPAYAGLFGIYVHNASGFVRDPQYLFHKEPQ